MIQQYIAKVQVGEQARISATRQKTAWDRDIVNAVPSRAIQADPSVKPAFMELKCCGSARSHDCKKLRQCGVLTVVARPDFAEQRFHHVHQDQHLHQSCQRAFSGADVEGCGECRSPTS